jgi:hypothetical protein
MTGTNLLKVSKYNLTIIKHVSLFTFREDIENKNKNVVLIIIFLEKLGSTLLVTIKNLCY